MPKPVAVIGPDSTILREIERDQARLMVRNSEAKWWDGCRAVRLLVFDERGQSARPGPAAIQRYVEVRSSLPPGAVNETIAAVDCWVFKEGVRRGTK